MPLKFCALAQFAKCVTQALEVFRDVLARQATLHRGHNESRRALPADRSHVIRTLEPRGRRDFHVAALALKAGRSKSSKRSLNDAGPLQLAVGRASWPA